MVVGVGTDRRTGRAIVAGDQKDPQGISGIRGRRGRADRLGDGDRVRQTIGKRRPEPIREFSKNGPLGEPKSGATGVLDHRVGGPGVEIVIVRRELPTAHA